MIAEALLDDVPPQRLLQEDHDESRDIIYKDRVVKDGTLICPHCNQEIHEKGTYSDDDGKTTRHGVCRKPVRFKPPTDDVLAHIEQAWGIKFNKDTREWTPVAGKKGNDDMGEDEYDDYA